MGTIKVSNIQYGKLVAPDVQSTAGCREVLFRIRWPGGFYCEACGYASHVAKSKQKSIIRRIRDKGFIRCPGCRKDGSVLSGTAFEGSRLPLPTWLRAISVMASSQRPLSISQLCDKAAIDRWQSAQHVAAKVRGLMQHPDTLLERMQIVDDLVCPLPDYEPLFLWLRLYRARDGKLTDAVKITTIEFESSIQPSQPACEKQRLLDTALNQLYELGPRIVTRHALPDYLAEIGFKLTYKTRKEREQELLQRAAPPAIFGKPGFRISNKRQDEPDISV